MVTLLITLMDIFSSVHLVIKHRLGARSHVKLWE